MHSYSNNLSFCWKPRWPCFVTIWPHRKTLELFFCKLCVHSNSQLYICKLNYGTDWEHFIFTTHRSSRPQNEPQINRTQTLQFRIVWVHVLFSYAQKLLWIWDQLNNWNRAFKHLKSFSDFMLYHQSKEEFETLCIRVKVFKMYIWSKKTTTNLSNKKASALMYKQTEVSPVKITQWCLWINAMSDF